MFFWETFNVIGLAVRSLTIAYEVVVPSGMSSTCRVYICPPLLLNIAFQPNFSKETGDEAMLMMFITSLNDNRV
jgi:hypothetical protein